MNGIYTLANDYVYDQLIALLNSIEVNAGKNIPVVVIAYDDQVERISEEISHRANVELLNEPEIFDPWERFSYEAWKGHPNALQKWSKKGIQGVNRIGMNRRYCAFDPRAPFEYFLYFDADVLVLNSVDYIFQQLRSHQFVVYDFQYKDPTHIFNVTSSKLHQIFSEDRIQKEIFCAGFYAGRRGLFTTEQRQWLVDQLNSGEGEILYPSAPNQSLLNYMKMRLEIPVYNFALELPPEKRTGCSVTSPHFQEKAASLYDKGERLTYLHYIGLSSSLFSRLCQGENIDFPYRELFLHYRYLRKPETRVSLAGKPEAYNAPPSFYRRVARKLGL
jgi:hypothetical protein